MTSISKENLKFGKYVQFFVWWKLDLPGREGAEITALIIANKTTKDLQGHILFWTSI